MPNLQHRDEKDAEESRGVGGDQAGLDYTEGQQNQGRGRSEEAAIKSAVEKKVFILQQLELDFVGHWLLANLGKFHEADPVDERLQDQERHHRKNCLLIEHGSIGLNFFWNFWSGAGGS